MWRQWNHVCFGVREVSKRTGSNPVHGPSVAGNRSKHMLYVTVSPTPTMDGGSNSDFTVYSATSPVRFTSTPRVSHHVGGRQPLNEIGIRSALELTVSTIIESEDSDVPGSDTDIGGSTTNGGRHSTTTTSNSYCVYFIYFFCKKYTN
ncbi:hypothetical protein E2C01_083157 [Portunus trituberculatus]|uniref:Uncharacterized protein n=1 Tax=Portunus trituberculatus TaxID=210409 RepID=A0A5B7J3R6_PORTR|nr:hypothetical protein [Portunus trituberculatus]